MPSLATNMHPGVMIQRVDAARIPPITLRTDIVALVGTAERGPLDTPVAIESVRQFSAHFGTFLDSSYLAYAVRGFFENGGLRCWVVRVAARQFDPEGAAVSGARPAQIYIRDKAGRTALRVAASSAGTWGNGLTLEWAVSGRHVTNSAPGASTAQYSTVQTVAGFAVDELVRIEQGTLVQYRVIAAIDAVQTRIYWIDLDPQRRRAIQRALSGFDASQPLRIIRIAYSLNVRERASIVASYQDLHLVPSHPRYLCTVLSAPVYWNVALGQTLLDANVKSSARQRADDAFQRLPDAPEPIVITLPDPDDDPSPSDIPLPLDVPFDSALQLASGADGLTELAPQDFIGEPWDPTDSDLVRARKSRGAQALALIDEISLVAAPDLLIQPRIDPDYVPIQPPARNPCISCPPPAPPRNAHQPRIEGEVPPLFTHQQIAQAQAALIDLCDAAGDRFAIISLPFDIATEAVRSREDAIAWRTQFTARCAALYATWVAVSDPLNVAPTRLVPPCGHVLGAIARTDLAWGVQQAPGNVDLSGVTAIARPVDDDLYSEWNDSNVNVIRAEYGRTPVVGGVRTLAFEPQWRFINVVRLLMTIKKAAELALRWVVFAPNDPALRANVRTALLAILRLFYVRGAFAGATEAESFFVRCDETTTPPELRDLGELVALVGIAPAAPAEFIVIRVGRQYGSPAVSLFSATANFTGALGSTQP